MGNQCVCVGVGVGVDIVFKLKTQTSQQLMPFAISHFSLSLSVIIQTPPGMALTPSPTLPHTTTHSSLSLHIQTCFLFPSFFYYYLTMVLNSNKILEDGLYHVEHVIRKVMRLTSYIFLKECFCN